MSPGNKEAEMHSYDSLTFERNNVKTQFNTDFKKGSVWFVNVNQN